MRLRFIKCHGSGNDFAMIDARALAVPDADWAVIARLLSDRGGPVGSDGILLFTGGDRIGFRMFNADGSEAETCLNGLRCVARAGFEALGVEAATVSLRTSTAHVARDADIAPGVYTVRETAGPASTDVRQWPLTGEGEAIIERRIAAIGSDRAFTAVSIPNPHLVSFVEAVDDVELSAIGARCEAAPGWLPNRANVSFVEQRGPDLFVRTFERGVGLTNSCGSAMAAATYAACLTGRIAFDVPLTVFNRGGMVRAEAGADGLVTLSGNATFEWAGSITIDTAHGTAGELTVDRRFDDEVDAWQRAIIALG